MVTPFSRGSHFAFGKPRLFLRSKLSSLLSSLRELRFLVVLRQANFENPRPRMRLATDSAALDRDPHRRASTPIDSNS
jgi:hypothetical protein